MTTKYVYPAIFEKEDCGYSVYFPDVEGCVTSGTRLLKRRRMRCA